MWKHGSSYQQKTSTFGQQIRKKKKKKKKKKFDSAIYSTTGMPIEDNNSDFWLYPNPLGFHATFLLPSPSNEDSQEKIDPIKETTMMLNDFIQWLRKWQEFKRLSPQRPQIQPATSTWISHMQFDILHIQFRS
jgi:hypothetical protein